MKEQWDNWIQYLINRAGQKNADEVIQNVEVCHNHISSAASEFHPSGLDLIGQTVADAKNNGGHHTSTLRKGEPGVDQYRDLIKGRGGEILVALYGRYGVTLELMPGIISAEVAKKKESKTKPKFTIV